MAEHAERGGTPALGTRVRRLRTALGLSQAQLGLRVDLSQPRISQIENETPTTPLPLRTLRDLAAALEVTIAALISNDPLYDLFDLDEAAQHAAIGSHLPLLASPFIGRNEALDTVLGMLRRGDCRVLTLVGPAGVGKTQLALHVAESLRADAVEQVGVSLSACDDLADAMKATARAIGLPERDASPLDERLKAALGERHVVLLWDNAEHVRSAVALLAQDLARACPNLTMLVTSRAPLSIQLEQVYQVAPLQLPLARTSATLASASASPAVQLFVHRAAVTLPGFALKEVNAATIAEICCRLDGLPLALVLAAAKTSVMTLQQLLETLDRRMALLTSEARDIPRRQRSLRANIAWSYDLLQARDQALFRALAVFVNGFTLEAAREIQPDTASAEPNSTEASDWSASNVANGISRLLDLQLLTRTEQPEGIPRFGMLESIHAFARERLDASPETSDISLRHLRWCLSFAEQAIARMFTVDESEWLAKLRQEDANIQAAMSWALGPGRSVGLETGRLLAGILADYWLITGMLSDGRAWLQCATKTDDADLPSPGLARCLVGSCLLAQAQAAIADAETQCEQGLAVARQLADRATAGRATLLLGNLALMRGDLTIAHRLHEAALHEFRALDDLPWAAVALVNLGMDLYRLGNYVQAAACANEALAISRANGSRWDTTAALRLLGDIARDSGEFTQATTLFSESLTLSWQHGNERDAADSLSGLGTVYVAAGDLEQAARMLGASEALYQRFQIAFPPPLRPDWDQAVATIRRGLNGDEATQAWGTGTPEHVVREAIRRRK